MLPTLPAHPEILDRDHAPQFHPTIGSFGAVSVPFTNFTDFWDDATGKAIHTCAEKSAYCPDEKTLRNMKTMSIWAEGVEGHVHLEVQKIDGYGCSATVESA